MPPTLRSANSSPAGKSAIPGASPGRKAPTCSKCGQLRLGHPRTGCPSTDPPSKDTRTEAQLQDNISGAFSSMHLDASPVKDRRRSGVVLQQSETLASISPSAEDMLNDLTQPGFFSQETVPDDNKRSKDSVCTPHQVRYKSGPKILMPGTLAEPSWESSIEGFSDDERDGEGLKKGTSPSKNSLGVQTSFASLEDDTSPSPCGSFSLPPPASSSATSSPEPVQRSVTLETRELLLSSLSRTSPATVYTHKKHELETVLASALTAKLHARVVENESDEENVSIVIGSDLHAVEKRREELARSVRSPTEGTTYTTNNFIFNESSDSRSGSSSRITVVASAVVVGMITAWAGLASSAS